MTRAIATRSEYHYNPGLDYFFFSNWAYFLHIISNFLHLSERMADLVLGGVSLEQKTRWPEITSTDMVCKTMMVKSAVSLAVTSSPTGFRPLTPEPPDNRPLSACRGSVYPSTYSVFNLKPHIYSSTYFGMKLVDIQVNSWGSGYALSACVF
jgi:hypothetical protein